MNTLIPEDLHHVMARTPLDVRELLVSHPELFLAGGCIRSIIAGEEVNDIDLFGPSKELLRGLATAFALGRKGSLHETDNAFTVLTAGRRPVQFIHRWCYTAPEQVINDFDFSIAQAIIWWKPNEISGGTWLSRISEHYYPDLASKRLRYLAPKRAEDAGGSLLRMRKFIERGYHIEALSLGKVVARLAMGVRHIQETIEEEQLSQVLTGLLREVDPLTVIDGVEIAEPNILPNTQENTSEI